MGISPYEDSWLLDDTEVLERLALEIRLNDPRTGDDPTDKVASVELESAESLVFSLCLDARRRESSEVVASAEDACLVRV